VPAFTVAGDTETERHRWRETARTQVAFYGSTPNYGFMFELLGRPDTTARLRERQKAGDIAGMTALIDDELLAHFVVEGTWAELADLLLARYSGVATRIVLYVAGMAWASDRQYFERLGAVAAAVRAA